MQKPKLEMRFDPQTINHLGLRMYSTLPPALAEIISNSYDADAKNVIVTLKEKKGRPSEINVVDDGMGLSLQEIKDNFLVIGRNRRENGESPSKKFKRLPTGKKGLGKLALFGLANTITIQTIQNKLLNEFVLDWKKLMASKDVYQPDATKTNKRTKLKNGTKMILSGLKRKSSFDIQALADSLSRIFLFDKNFNLIIKTPNGDRIKIDNKRKYSTFEKEFEWDLSSTILVPKNSDFFGKIEGQIFTSIKPITPSSGLRGITLYSRGKLINAPEYFSPSTSSHFYQYLTGWISADFIDLLKEDVISTNRQSVDWENPQMIVFRRFLTGLVSQINTDWRKQRKEKKDKELSEKTGINTTEWTDTMPSDVKTNIDKIIDALRGEDSLEKYTPIIKTLHEIVPDYPLLHWRHLHKEVRKASAKYYKDANYYTAFIEAIKKYVNAVKNKSGERTIPEKEMMGKVFRFQNVILDVVKKYKQKNGDDFSPLTFQNIQEGQQLMSQGIIVGGRHPLAHEEVKELKISGLFSEKDCLDLLSLLSHLFNRLDNSIKN